MASRVIEVFTLQKDPGPTAMLGESSCFGDDGGSSGVRLVELIKLTRKGGILACLLVGLFQLIEGVDERFGDEPSPELTVIGPLHLSQ